jgi:hypothetical protein
MEQEDKKKIDEDWQKQTEQTIHQPTFSIFLSSLGMQAMIALGKLENPLTKQIEKNYEQARFLIDTLAIIKEKTINNLAQEEQALLDDYLFNLRMLYLELKKEPDGT